MKLIQAQIVKAPRQVTTKYGVRTVADAIDENGNNQTIWRPENDPVLSRLTINSRVTLTMDSKGKINLVDNQNEPTAIAPTQPQNNQELSNTRKREIAEYITQQTKLFDFCYQQTKLIDGLTDEDRRAVATTLFLNAQKKFSL